MADGIFSSSKVGGPVAHFLSTTASAPPSAALNARIEQHVVGPEEADATPPPSPVLTAIDPWAKNPAMAVDDEDEEDDSDFDGHESEDDDVGDEEGNASSSGDDDDDDDDEPVVVRHRKSPIKLKSAARRPHVPVTMDYDDDDDEEGDSCNSFDEDDDDDEDEEEYEEDDGFIVYTDAARCERALRFKCDYEALRPQIATNMPDVQSIRNMPEEELWKRRKEMQNERYQSMMDSLNAQAARLGHDVLAPAPQIADEEFEKRVPKSKLADGEKRPASNDDCAEPEQKSPTCTLVHQLVSMVERDEPDLSELMALMSKTIFLRTLSGYRQSPVTSLALAEIIEPVWGKVTAPSAQFYKRVRDMLAHQRSSTERQYKSALVCVIESAVDASALHEFVAVDMTVNTLHQHHKDGYLCAGCAQVVEPRMVGTGAQAELKIPTVKLMLRDKANVNRGSASVKPFMNSLKKIGAKSSMATCFVVCDLCSKVIVTAVNDLITAPYDLAMLARAWIYQNENALADPGNTQEILCNEFNSWDLRRDRCIAIVNAYTLLHCLCLN